MKSRLLIIIGIVGMLLVPVNLAQGLPVLMDCKYDSDFMISTNKLEFTQGETFVINVKTIQNNDPVFEMLVMNPKGQEVFADIIYLDDNGTAQGRFHIPDDAEKGTWSVFVTATPSHQQEVIFIGVDEIPQSTLSIKSSFVNHEYKIDDALFLIAGESKKDVQITILDPNSEKKHIYIITLPSEGKCNFSLDLDGYKPGVYDVEITDHNDDATTVFTVGLRPSMGRIDVSLAKYGNNSLTDTALERTNGGSISPDNTIYPFPWEDRPPLKQFKDGIHPEVIHCNDNLLLIQKYDGSPACVKEQSIIPLMVRDWARISEFEITSGFLKHEIENGKIISLKLVDEDCAPFLVVTIDSQDVGQLTISIPRKILDHKIGDFDDDFFVLIDGKEVDFKEVDTNQFERTLDIPFVNDSKSIEIIKVCLI